MDPSFKFFYPGVCKDDQPIFGLIDMIDNHFMIQSHDVSALYETRQLIKHKTLLEIVNISDFRYDKNGNRLTDNYIIEKWGIDLSTQTIRIDPLTSSRFADLNKKENYISKIPVAQPCPSDVEFDEYKKDLQKQIFFLYKIIVTDLKFADVRSCIQKICFASMDYQSLTENFGEVSQLPFDEQIKMLHCLKYSGILYE